MNDDEFKSFLLDAIKSAKNKYRTLRVLNEGRIKLEIANAFNKLTPEQLGVSKDERCVAMISVEPMTGPQIMPTEYFVLRDSKTLLLSDGADAGLILSPPSADGKVMFFGQQDAAKIALKILRRSDPKQKAREQVVTVTCSLKP